ncbi:SDR family oxidoreductase [Ruficoccus sp. ZRK36]|uniref:SDR family oxidoreductase n=1 Tax=Ruficoccus sp. ZRK36 TaxID=2866311 RepID=UPI001C736542|nr:SDR family oxidoreductase [Ruficoccus sp. ZRK36]QYY36989.1 SDR family oxidoreductase [Ruficoccus sp. ZRK36]
MSDSPSRIAIVTGASSGIGEATVRRFVSQGYGVIGNARSADKLAALEKELGPLFKGVAGSAAEKPVVDSLFTAAVETFGAEADIVVANAGTGLGGSVTQADLEKYETILKLNVAGALALMQEAALRMVKKQETDYPKSAADLVVIGSVVGKQISPFSAVYGSTKWAVHSLAEGLRREICGKGVRVTLVAPGIVVSGFQDAAGYNDETVNHFHKNFGPLLVGDDIAAAIEHVVALPPHIHISDLTVRPTRQDYP